MAEVHPWRLFLRAFADEIDSLASLAEREDMLRGVGARMARLAPLPPASTFAMLTLEIEEGLAALGWGRAEIALSEADRYLVITHHGLPRIGALGEPPGTWLSPVLEGLYEEWMRAQPGGEPNLVARRTGDYADGAVTLRYGRG